MPSLEEIHPVSGIVEKLITISADAEFLLDEALRFPLLYVCESFCQDSFISGAISRLFTKQPLKAFRCSLRLKTVLPPAQSTCLGVASHDPSFSSEPLISAIFPFSPSENSEWSGVTSIVLPLSRVTFSKSFATLCLMKWLGSFHSTFPEGETLGICMPSSFSMAQSNTESSSTIESINSPTVARHVFPSC